MHIGSSSVKPSKTECILLPAPGHFKLPVLPGLEPPPNPSSSCEMAMMSRPESPKPPAAMGSLNHFWHQYAVEFFPNISSSTQYPAISSYGDAKAGHCDKLS